MSAANTARAWLRLGRVSNLPTTFTNVLAGSALALPIAFPLNAWPATTVLLSIVAVSCLYLGGMALNDVIDADWDRANNNPRPIADGDIRRSSAAIAATALLLLGVAILATRNPTAGVLAATLAGAIVAYDFLHKKFPASVLLMGLCRGLVILTAAAAIDFEPTDRRLLLVASAMTVYVVLLTIVARSEHTGQTRARAPLFTLLASVPLLPVFFVHTPNLWMTGGAAFAMVAGIMMASQQCARTPPNARAAVMGWLAAICLIDAYTLIMLGFWPAAIVAYTCWILTLLAHRRISGT